MEVKVAKIFFEKQRNFRDRVSKAYHDYGRLCSAHPLMCLSISILTTVFLSYPALSKIRLPISSPMETYWGNRSAVNVSANESVPDWLYLPPAVYLQHFIIKVSVEPWNSANLTVQMAIKGPLSAAFKIQKLIEEVRVGGDADKNDPITLNSACLRAPFNALTAKNLLPKVGSCLTLSPTLFWNNNLDNFFRDNEIFHTIFDHSCTSAMCARDILFGAPVRLTGIKPTYQTNRRRSIEYSITVLLSVFSNKWRSAIINHLSKQFKVEKSRAFDDDTFIHVFYKPRKYFTDYFPLFTSYFLCMLYFYYTVSKFEMVKNKWALALAAFITVFTTLSSTAGICSYFELTPTLWGAGLYPYLAMVFGLENILCITRSVVYTPPTLDVQSRLSHGLSQEGFSISKYFVLEMMFLFFGYITCVSEIQEFCTFAFIGLVVDFYMQLFFYAPILLFDLQRLDNEEKQKFALMLFNTDIKKIKNYPKLRCPAEKVVPFLFAKHRRRSLFRTLSDTNVGKKKNLKLRVLSNTRRRTASTEKIAMFLKRDTLVSNRLRLLYYWTKTRFFQRLLMFFFCFWVLWLAFIVHKWRLFDILRNTLGNNTVQNEALGKSNSYSDGFGISHYMLETAPLEWSEWQRNTFKWWPAFFGEYNISLSGHYVTFAPPIVLRATILPNDSSLLRHSVDENFTNNAHQSTPSVLVVEDNLNSNVSLDPQSPELGNRIYWLERQITAMLVFSTILPFSIVVAFILYIFWDKWISYRKTKQVAEIIKNNSKLHSSVRNHIDLVPLLFARHLLHIECVAVYSSSIVVSASFGGQVLIWDSFSGELKHTLNCSRNAFPQTLQKINQVQFSLEQDHLAEQKIRQRQCRQSETPQNTKKIEINERPLNIREFEDADEQYLFSTPHSQSLNNVDSEKNHNRYIRLQVWCLDVRQNIMAIGYSSGLFELYSFLPSVNQIGRFAPEEDLTPGVSHIKIKGNRIILARLNGTLETYKFSPNLISTTTEGPLPILNQKFVPSFLHLHSQYLIQKLTLTRAHQKPVIQLICTSFYVITISYDCTVKVFDIESPQMRLLYTLNGHDQPVCSICVDESTNMLFSSCEAGVILCWNLTGGQLLQTLDNDLVEESGTIFDDYFASNLLTEIETTSELLIGFNIPSKMLTIWNKFTYELITRITPNPIQREYTNTSFQADILSCYFANEEESQEGRHLLIMNENLAITSSEYFLYLWDLDVKMLSRQIRLSKAIDKICKVNQNSLLCCCGSFIYVVTLPSIISSKHN